MTAWTATSAVGRGNEALVAALAARRGGLRRNDFPGSKVDSWIGRVEGVEAVDWSGEAAWESRNNALARLGLEADGFLDAVAMARERFGPRRVGVLIGTSTSSIGRTEEAYRLGGGARFPEAFRQPQVHNPHSPGAYVAHRTGLTGPQLTISTACASSARVFASAWRWLQAGIVDAVLVGGVDSLCHSVLAGFRSLELTSPEPCRPFDARRNGISIGEAAGFALLVRAGDAPDDALRLAGYGESSDAFHMSQPPPGGEGARRSMRAALDRAGLAGPELGYVNLHGTASQANDTAEAEALAALLPESVAAASTKGWTGHTLGAAGILEAVITLEALRRGLLPGTLNLETREAGLAFPVAMDNSERPIRYAMSNSFGFGGNNCSLVFEKPPVGGRAGGRADSRGAGPVMGQGDRADENATAHAIGRFPGAPPVSEAPATLALRIAGIGALGPGFDDWPGLRALLDDAAQATEPAPVRPAPESIPPRERRRAPLSVKLAVAVAEQACADAGIAPADTVSVFASGMGDMDITDYMCRTLAEDEPLLSPTKFHNSVHNAPVGYWTISQAARLSSNAVAGHALTVPASLLEAATQCQAERVPVLWACQDIAAPAPFRDITDTESPCAFALVLMPLDEKDALGLDNEKTELGEGDAPGRRRLQLSVQAGSGAWPASGVTPGLAKLYETNPTARLLPLLGWMIRGDTAPLRLPLGATLDLVVNAA